MTDDAALMRTLLDIEAIKQLKARYFRMLDGKDWEGFGAVFAERGVLDVPEADAVMEGGDVIASSVSGALEGARTVHHGHMPEIEITGPDTATGIWAMDDYVEWPPGETGERIGIRGYGHYVESYVRERGEWRIDRSRLDRLRIDPLT